jgi:HlyD family secretion protein
VKTKRTRWIVILIVLAVVAVAGSLVLGGGGAPLYAVATAQTGSITTYYNFSGSMDVNQSMTVSAPAEATVSEVYVRQNGQVAKNARLMRLSDGTILKADIAGEVTSLEAEAGNLVRAGDVLAEIMNLDTLTASFKVDEFDVSSVEIGKEAQVTLDGSGNIFMAKVTGLNKRATLEGDLSYYTASIDLGGTKLPADALPGMQITVKLLNNSAENVVLLPMEAISFTAQNEPYVLMPDGKETRSVGIELGINDGDNVEIRAGLKSGETVLYTPTATQDIQAMMERRRNSAWSTEAN